jgi:hypothetical protein
MSQAFSDRHSSLVPMRWLYADGNRSRPDRVDQSTERLLMRSERPPKCKLDCSELPARTSRSRHAGIASTSKVGASIKSP